MRVRIVTIIGASLALGASTFLGSEARGADYPILRGTHAPSLPPAPAIAPAPLADWNGFYFGGLGGYSAVSFSSSRGPNALVANALRQTTAEADIQASSLLRIPGFSARGMSYGGFFGFNAQFDEAVVGVEFDYMRLGRQGFGADAIGRSRGTSDGYITNVSLTGRSEARLDDLITMRLRAGYAMGNFMPYITGGLAFGYGSVRNSATAIVSGVDADPLSAPALPSYTFNSGELTEFRRRSAMAGVVVGAGVEALFGGLLLRAEYLHTRLQAQGGTDIQINQARAGVGVKF
jgi:opacity protein-like surface antigen